MNFVDEIWKYVDFQMEGIIYECSSLYSGLIQESLNAAIFDIESLCCACHKIHEKVFVPEIVETSLAQGKPTDQQIHSWFYFNPKQAICCPVSPVPTVDTNVKEEVLEQEETEKAPENVEILRNLLENRVKNRELDDALSIINKLIELEPDEIEWRFLKSHLYVHNGEIELAKLGFRDVILKDPYYVEAYRGLVVAASEDESVEEMKKIEKQVMEGINMCEKEEKESELRDLKLILAQIWVIGGKYDEALKVYQELVDEEPGDFRPYLCQGMIYTALKKNDEAEKYFEKYRGLVPQDHTNARFEFMMAT
ncbi:protein SLOW GREEN 1, chloroplastic [Solanum tuberosum]|uniref:protein SLOW GREEN 1, chloroplastic n=1 Tax=Solanum tuberosum TaxID=4113 RepID=UPI000739FB8B|nr:PREDICTED: protein SLOW GREEN 1, chloroplastic [Solanum tuberosum]